MVLRMATPWQDAAKAKVRSTAAKIPSDWLLDHSVLNEARHRTDITGEFIENLLSPDEVEITSFECIPLLLALRGGHFTAEQVTVAFCKRAAIAHQINNCLHEIFFDQAIERARELDRQFIENGSTTGPLHGLPISLKDQFHVKGVETTMGYVGWIGTFEGKKGTGKEKNTNSNIVQDLLDLGAVLYCKTSLPQTLLIGETHNNIIGYTMNPVNQGLSCGGSSGGEAALQALRGSLLGLGSDIGGSVRIPAAFCGTFSIKPSVGRFSYANVANSVPGQTVVSSAIGFMATELQSLKMIMESILSVDPWRRDPELAPLPWREDQEIPQHASSLCFGILECDGIVRPHPPIARGLKQLKHALSRAGHKIIPWFPPEHEAGYSIHDSFIASDGGADIFRQLDLSGEPLIPEKAEDIGNSPSQPLPLLDYQDLCLRRKAYRLAYAEHWESTAASTGLGRPVDAIIMPVAPTAAVIPGEYWHYAYSAIVNLLDYSSVVIPVTRADKAIDKADPHYKPLNDTDKHNWEAYDAAKYDGAPVGLQIVGRTLQEERTLSIAQIAYDALKNADLNKD